LCKLLSNTHYVIYYKACYLLYAIFAYISIRSIKTCTKRTANCLGSSEAKGSQNLAKPVFFYNYLFSNRVTDMFHPVAFCNYLFFNRVTAMIHPVAFGNYLFSNRVITIIHPVAFGNYLFSNRVTTMIHPVAFAIIYFPTG